MRVTSLGSIDIILANTPAVEITCDTQGSSSGDAFLIVSPAGKVQADSADRAVIRGGTSALIMQGAAVLQLTSRVNRVLLVRVPGPLLPPNAKTIERRVDGTELSARRLAPLYLFLQVLAGTSPSERLSQSLTDAATKIVMTLASAIVNDTVATPPAHLYDAARAYLEVNYANVNIDMGAVAQRLGVAPRTLQAAFASRGTTFSETLRTLRVGAARTLQKDHPSIPASSIAMICGFPSVSTMYRALRATPPLSDQPSAEA